jgi:ribosome biogenesis GTPase
VVVEVSTGVCEVTVEDRKLQCTPRAALRAVDTGFTNLVAVGDEVVVSVIGAERGIVEAVLPRRSALARPDVFYPHLQQVIVANVDQLLIVASWREPAYWPELVDRYVIGAERNRLTPIICVNKVDLASIREEPQRALAPYEQLGYRVLFTSAVNGTGLRELKHLLHRRTTALAGLSGVGKSSLLRAVEPGLQLRIEKVSDRHHEGRHTTTQVSLHPLKEGGLVVDTPGIREFGFSGLIQRDLAQFYPEIAALATGCRFTDCTHTREPDCAVRLAEREGRLSRMRFDNYRKILRTLPT